MYQFNVRVEMHYATEANYAELHRRMERAGYSRFVRDESGQVFHLPTATYDRKTAGYMSAKQVREEVQAIAHSVESGAWVLVNRYDDSAWFMQKSDRAAA